MRIATSTLYGDQTSSIDNLYATYQNQGQQLSTGKSLNAPSDDPTVIAQDLSVRADNTVQTQLGKNFTDLQNELTTVDGALSNLTSVLQQARNLAVQGASDTINSSQRGDIATQIDQLLSEAIGFANTQYNGKYVFGGTSVPSTIPLVVAHGSPVTSVTSQGNIVQQTLQDPNGTTITNNVTLQQAFNFNSTDGSPDVFQTLIKLRDTLRNGQVVDESQQAINLRNTVVATTTTATQLAATGATQIMATPLTFDSTGNLAINIASASSPSGVNIQILPTDTVAGILAKINAQTGTTGVAASFNAQTQRLSLTSTANPASAFTVNDVGEAGSGTTTGNFVSAFGLTNQASTTGYVSTQLGDIDHVTEVMLNARAEVGSSIQAAGVLKNNAGSQVLNDTSVQSSLEDTDIAKVTSQFSQTQTILQAAYATTTRLEGKTLFDYLG
ncbi:MAG TPA: flagellar hook-associated protein FlgL [Candidatus Aquilonibacter sp.]|nr:flagellar hook-associated protein FlgL [Candidatus Aquilonibacter sp.]